MRVVNVPRGDLSALYGAGINTYGGTFNMGNMSQETMSSGKHGQYIQEINNYYQSDAYIELANELSALQYKTNLDISIYLINSDDIAVGKLMQEYMMASPYLARAYDSGLITGYSPESHRDTNLEYLDRHRYNQVEDGLLEEGEDDLMYYTQYITDDTDLDIEDQLTIKSSWEYIKRRILQGVDLTEQ